jgi:hypothetical protein
MPSPDLLLKPVVCGLLIPAAVTLFVLLLGLRSRAGASLAIFDGLAAGLVALAATKQITPGFLRPAESWDWLPAVALLACAAGLLKPGGGLSFVLCWATRLAVAGLTAWVLIRAQSERESEPLSRSWHVALAVAIFIVWVILDLAASRRPDGLVPTLLAVVALAAAALAEMGGFMTVCLMATVVPGALAGGALVAWLRPDPDISRAGTPALAVLLPAVLFISYFNNYSDVSAASYLLLLAAPLCLGVAALLPLRAFAGRWATLILVAAALVPAAVALALAKLAQGQPS